MRCILISKTEGTNLFLLNYNSLGIVGLGMTIGLVLGVTGAGGAILSVPLLVVALQLTVNQAAPIGLMAVTLAAGITALIGLKEGIVRYKAAALMAAFGLLLSPLGFWAAQRLPNAPLVIVFSLVLCAVAIRMWRSGYQPIGQLAPTDNTNPALPNGTLRCIQSEVTGKFIWTLPCARALALTGAAAGFLSGLIGVGGGFIIVPSLKDNTNLAMHSVVATSLAVIALVSAGGVVVAASQGLMDWLIAVPFSLGTVLGTLVARTIARRLPNRIISRGFAVLAIAAAGLMLLKLF
jgi:uncharacterized protein